MGGVDIGTSGVRGTHLEPRGIPEHRQIVLHHIAAQRNLTSSRNEHSPTLLKHPERLGIEGIGYIERLLGTFYISRINPEIPMVLDAIRELNSKCKLGRRGELRQRQRDNSKLSILAQSDIDSRQHATYIANTPNGLYTAEGTFGGVINLDGHTQCISTGINELGEQSQRHYWRAELTPLRC